MVGSGFFTSNWSMSNSTVFWKRSLMKDYGWILLRIKCRSTLSQLTDSKSLTCSKWAAYALRSERSFHPSMWKRMLKIKWFQISSRRWIPHVNHLVLSVLMRILTRSWLTMDRTICCPGTKHCHQLNCQPSSTLSWVQELAIPTMTLDSTLTYYHSSRLHPWI